MRAVAAAERVLPAGLMRRARVAKFDRTRRRFQKRIVEHEYAGVRHRVVLAAPYDERYDCDWPELQEIAWLKQRRLRPGARAFDLGANSGVFAMLLADAVGPEGRVIAVEADPGDAATIAENRDLNRLDQIEPIHAAVASTEGELVFGRHGSVDDGSRRWGDRRVPSVTIDGLAERHGPPDVVFVDIEGYEHEALRGAEMTLERGPDWYIEVHGDEELAAYGSSCAAVIDVMRNAGYELFAAPDSPYVLLEDGSVGPALPIAPLGEWPAELLHRRFFLLASRTG